MKYIWYAMVEGFYTDASKEQRYREGVNGRIEVIRKLFGEDYVDVLHRPVVEQLVRCELAMEDYEMRLSREPDTPRLSELLRSERVHWRRLSDQLNLTLRSMRGDSKNIRHEFPSDFKDYMKVMLESAAEDVDDPDAETEDVDEAD